MLLLDMSLASFDTLWKHRHSLVCKLALTLFVTNIWWIFTWNIETDVDAEYKNIVTSPDNI